MAEPLVLLPAMMCDARLYLHQIAGLSVDRAVHVAPITQGESVAEIAKSILMDAPPRFALAGMDMGGIVAMEIQRIAPERVTRLALMGTNAQSEPPIIAAAREELIVKARAGRLEEVMRNEAKALISHTCPHRAELADLVTEMAMDMGPDIFARQSHVLQRRPDQQKTLRMLRRPAMVACGVHDDVTPVKRHEFLAELIPNARLEIIADAGHLPTLEQPEETNRHLRAWLAVPAAAPLVLR